MARQLAYLAADTERAKTCCVRIREIDIEHSSLGRFFLEHTSFQAVKRASSAGSHMQVSNWACS
jgi:hypothetical protein